MKLWQKGFEISKEIEVFTIGKDKDLDVLLAAHDVLGSLAHIKMLLSIGLLTQPEWQTLTLELRTIYQEIQQGKFIIEEGVEDVHSQVELILTRRLGEMGKKIHSGRSRNDQVLLDLKLFIRHEIEEVVKLVEPLFNTLITLSNRYKDVLLPGYTHYQVAMPSSFGLWFGAYAESLVDDMILLEAAYKITNKNPLGSAAGYGSSFPLNRQMTTDLMGFDALNFNVVYAQMGRGKTERIVADAMASIAATMSKLAQDVCLYISQNFGFVSLPDHLTTGSSIMPHKKNPDVFELIRAKCNKLAVLPQQIAMITANLPSGYHRDLQVIKEDFLPAFEDLKNCLAITCFMLENIKVNPDAIKDDRYRYMFSVEVVNQLVVEGTTFRDAYKIVGEDIASGKYKPSFTVQHTHEGSIGNLCNEEINRLMQQTLNHFGFEKIHLALNRLLTDDTDFVKQEHDHPDN
ncbi:MAG: argininosuccinate lyase [Sphingobacteriales bacterium]|nr:MAG: argininosuccinate lyase [Sphingobacteriales bacterium]